MIFLKVYWPIMAWSAYVNCLYSALCGVKLGVFHDSEFDGSTHFAPKPIIDE